MGGLAVNGKLIIIGASDESLELSPNFFLFGHRSVVGWLAGSSIDGEDMLLVHLRVLCCVPVFSLGDIFSYFPISSLALSIFYIIFPVCYVNTILFCILKQI